MTWNGEYNVFVDNVVFVKNGKYKGEVACIQTHFAFGCYDLVPGGK